MSSENDLEEFEPLAPELVPKHVAFIMDGNGRWAVERGLPRVEGHKQGTENLRAIFRAAAEFGVEILTLYAFSAENWGRPKSEVEGLLRIFDMALKREVKELHESDVQIRHMGDLSVLSPRMQKRVRGALSLTENNSRLIVNVGFNYSGRSDIIQAVRQILQADIPAEKLTEEVFSSFLWTAGLPDPDLVIRTGGDARISNFLIWELGGGAGAHFISVPEYWPDFGKAEFHRTLMSYTSHVREKTI